MEVPADDVFMKNVGLLGRSAKHTVIERIQKNYLSTARVIGYQSALPLLFIREPPYEMHKWSMSETAWWGATCVCRWVVTGSVLRSLLESKPGVPLRVEW